MKTYPAVRPGRLAVRHDPAPGFEGAYTVVSCVRLPGEGFHKSITGKFPGLYVIEMRFWGIAHELADRLSREHADRLLADAVMKEHC